MQARIDQLKLMGPVILNGIVKSLDHYSASESGPLVLGCTMQSFQLAYLLPIKKKTCLSITLILVDVGECF